MPSSRTWSATPWSTAIGSATGSPTGFPGGRGPSACGPSGTSRVSPSWSTSSRRASTSRRSSATRTTSGCTASSSASAASTSGTSRRRSRTSRSSAPPTISTGGSRRRAGRREAAASPIDDPPIRRRCMSGLRIIGGTFKGRQLLAPRGLETRPLPDRVKQALFDWLGQRMDGLLVVDCCAGSGAFTFEALSRGARRVEAIEPGPHAVPVLRANAAKLGAPPNLVLHPLPFRAVLPRLHAVDLLFADPPFAWYADDPGLVAELLRLGARCLAPAGRLVIRGERGGDLPEMPAGLVEGERRVYGRSWLALLQRSGADTATEETSGPLR